MMRRFKDRSEAGRALARALRVYGGDPQLVVVALPRGGVPVAYEVARALHAPLDVCVVRKLGVPANPELAMGAVASGDVCVMNPEVIQHLRVPRAVFDAVAARERMELARREVAYRQGERAAEVAGRTVLIVDDGLATGATMRAAVAAVRRRAASRVIVAVPVGAESTCRALADEADEVFCLLRPRPFYAIGEWYDAFPQVGDEDVRRLLSRAPAAPAAT